MIICAIVLGVLVIASVLFAVLRRPKKTANLQSLRGAAKPPADRWKNPARHLALLNLICPTRPRVAWCACAPACTAQQHARQGLLALLSATASTRTYGTKLRNPAVADLGSEPTTRLVEALQQRARW